MIPRATILVVEDNAITSKLVRVVLRDEGYEVLMAATGAAALEHAARQKPDLILQDLVLPDMSGFELVGRMRQLPGFADVIILAFTGFVSDAEDRRIVDAPFDGLLIKPVAPSRLVATIQDFLSRSGKARGARTASALPLQLRQPTWGLDPAQRAELQASAMGVLGTIADALSRQKDVEAALGEVLAQAVDAAGLSRGAVLLHQPDGALSCLSQVGFDTSVDELTTVVGPGLHAEIRAQGSVLILTPDTARSDTGRELLMLTGASSALVAPITAGPAEIGILLLTSATQLLTGEEWRGFARAVAAQLGQAIALRRAFESLSQSEQRYRHLFETVNLIVLGLDAHGVVDYVNPYYLRLTGYERDEVFGKSWFDFVPEAQRQHLREAFRELTDESRHAHYENSVVTKRGEVRVISWHNTVLRGPTGALSGTLSVGEDITERLHAETALRETEARFRQLAENINEVFFITDVPTGSCRYVSPAYEQIWGCSCESAYAEPYAWAEAIHVEDREAVALLFQDPDTLPLSGTVIVFRVVQSTGSIRWVRSRVFPVRNADGRVHRVVGVAEDITELRETERQLMQAQKMEAVGQLAGGIAHDFNNLLAAIMVFAELVQEDLPEKDEHRADLDQIQQAVGRAQRLTRQLLAFSRQQVLQPAVIDTNAAIGDLAKLLGRLIGEDIDLVLDLSPTVGTIRVDPGQFEQVLMNLAVNARDAMPSGGRLTFGTRRDGKNVVLTVSDTGTGMSDEVRLHIFEPFFTTKEGKGTGLGLATVHGIVQQSGGRIEVSSELGRGTTFTIALPATASEPAAATAAGTSETPRGTETILLVEDDPAVRHAASTVLRRLGYTVIVARSGAEGLGIAEEHTDPIHLALSDVVMPGMDGRDFLEHLRATRPAIKGALMSGYAGDVIARHGPLSAEIPLIVKPFTSRSLGEKVREILDA